MEDKLNKVKDILRKYNQEHLLSFYDELNELEKESLLNQILSINFAQILDLYENSKKRELNCPTQISPLNYIDKSILSNSEIDYYSKIGITAISKNQVAVITLAGGQGSRLGFKGPKGTFKIDTLPPKSLFEIICEYLKTANKNYNSNIPWYIMTSTENHKQTIAFFKQNNYFNYDPNMIFFFPQENLPLIDTNGKLLLEQISKVKVASNGNGNIFSSLKKHKILENLEQKNIKWIFVSGIDNVLLNPIDPLFIGLTINSQKEISAKTLLKEDPLDKSWIFARDNNNKPTIVDCENFVEQISNIKDKNGNYLYRETNMLAHIFTIDALKKMSTVQIPYHRAFRKCPFINYEGTKQVPDSPNIYKFEQFIFDSFSFFDDMLLLRTNRDDEFAPIKDFTGPYNPEIARKKYEKNILHIERPDD